MISTSTTGRVSEISMGRLSGGSLQDIEEGDEESRQASAEHKREDYGDEDEDEVPLSEAELARRERQSRSHRRRDLEAAINQARPSS